MEEIVEKILFYSEASRACDDPRLFSKRYFNDMIYFCVDHPEIRQIVSSRGKYFNVKNVPTLLLTFADGSLQLYEGPRVLLWMQNKIGGYSPVNTVPTQSTPTQSTPTQSTQPVAQKPSPISEPLPEEPTPVEQLTSEITALEEPSYETPIPQPQQPPINAGDKKSMDLKEIAKKMQMERDATYGYNESELPFN